MDSGYLLVISLGAIGAVLGIIAMLFGADVLGAAGIAAGAFAMVGGIAGMLWKAR